MQAQLEKAPPFFYNTVTVGGGPIGLLSLICALQVCPTDEKVALLVDRLDEIGLREQVLWIENDVFSFIEKIVGKELVDGYTESMAITENIIKTGIFITTGDLEQLFYDALQEQFKMGVHYDLIQSEKIGNANPKEKIYIDTKKNTISIFAIATNEVANKEPTLITVGFKYLISAEGAKRSIVKTMENEVFFDNTQSYKLSHTKHTVVTFQLPENTTPHDCYKQRVRPGEKGAETLDPCPLHHLQDKFGWKAHTRPYSQVLATRDIVYIGTEIPANLKDREAIRNYALTMMGDLLPQEYIKGVREVTHDLTSNWGRKKHQLSTSVFDLELGEINRTLTVCGNPKNEETTGIIFYLGDVRKNPLYTTGSGVQTGIKLVRYFLDFLTSKTELAIKLEDYHVSARVLIDEIREKQDKWIKDRNDKHDEAAKNYYLVQRIKGNSVLLDDLIQKVDLMISGDESEIIPLSFQKIHSKLMLFREQHSKIFDLCANEKSARSYNDIDPQAMISELQNLRKEVEEIYSSLPKSSQPTELYKNFGSLASKISAVSEQKASTMFFSPTETNAVIKGVGLQIVLN